MILVIHIYIYISDNDDNIYFIYKTYINEYYYLNINSPNNYFLLPLKIIIPNDKTIYNINTRNFIFILTNENNGGYIDINYLKKQNGNISILPKKQINGNTIMLNHVLLRKYPDDSDPQHNKENNSNIWVKRGDVVYIPNSYKDDYYLIQDADDLSKCMFITKLNVKKYYE